MIVGQRHDLAEVQRTYPLPDVLEASGLVLRRGRPGVFWAPCPFHADTTPSFLVDVRSADDPHFHCFGCRAHGDVVDFVRLRHGLATIGEALAHLTGAPPPPAVRAAGAAPRSAAIRTRRWDHLTLEEQLVLNTTVTLYQHGLWDHPPALAYLRSRGFSDGVLRRYGLGYSDGHSLEGHLRRHGGLRIAEHLGLLRRPEPGEGGRPLRERFAGRIVVPELRGGQPIWLIGRRPDDLSEVKYLSLPGERPILGLERVAGRREVFLAEGVFWLTAISWGLAAFSSCGTAMPPERLGWLARARVVWGVLDADRAGREGAARFGAALGRRWRPLALPEGCDLNDLGRRAEGRVTFFRLLHTAGTPLMAGCVRMNTDCCVWDGYATAFFWSSIAEPCARVDSARNLLHTTGSPAADTRGGATPASLRSLWLRPAPQENSESRRLRVRLKRVNRRGWAYF